MSDFGLSAQAEHLSLRLVRFGRKWFAMRSAAVGVADRIARCVGVRLPKAARRIEEESAGTSA
ncbi:MAG: hypothetical protein F4103_16090 [Boseongicola sp. SB0673_bin_14]|nr:hypothetical protein [Boseongicola sp. SB0667_bin_21]MYI70185.1 hypothetical protein [Boseongicola sp. SB0673_bin_14]